MHWEPTTLAQQMAVIDEYTMAESSMNLPVLIYAAGKTTLVKPAAASTADRSRGTTMDFNLLAEEEEEAREGHVIDLNLIAEEEEGAREGHATDLNLIAEEEDKAQQVHDMDMNLIAEKEEGDQHGHVIDLNLIAEDEEEAQEGHAIDLNMIAEEEEEARDGHAIDLNLIAEEEEGAQLVHAMDMNLMAEEEEDAREEEADAQGNPKKKELSDNERVKNRYYVLLGEPEPERTVSNTNSIRKLMFLTTVAKPQYNDEGEMTFGGKIGTRAFVVETEAQRNSQNRDRGMIEVKPVNVTRHVCREYLINKVIPTIQDKWPDNDQGTTIFIQQDNTKPHVLPSDAGFPEAVEQTDLDIQLLRQPPNSPKFNVLDLWFHRSLQSLTDCRAPMNIQELIQGVEEEFQKYDAHKLFKSFITLQVVMVEVMKDQGGNSYKMPHLHKDRLQNAGEEIISVYCSAELITNTMTILQQG
ncbi:hypothetical protein D1007_50995 [Hordeum vulgare]|nr:hypothetical protein D1007_50995 [Hordeum vulgare]